VRWVQTAALITVCLSATSALAQETVQGDPQAWREVVAAYQQLAAVNSYRMRKSRTTLTEHVPSSAAVLASLSVGYPVRLAHTVDVVNPDRFRIVMPLPSSGSIELISIGGEARGRVTRFLTGFDMWVCLPSTLSVAIGPSGFPLGTALTNALRESLPILPPLVSALVQFSKLQREATISRLGESSVDGVRSQGYQYWVTFSDSSGQQMQNIRERLFVNPERNLPLRTEVLGVGDNRTGTVDYSAFNSPMSITLPSCQG